MSSKLKFHLLAIVFLLGFSSLSFELIVLRQLINFVGSNALITSVVMTVVLLFLSLGYYIGSTISLCKYALRKHIQTLFVAVMFAYVLACPYYLMHLYFYAFYLLQFKTVLWFVGIYSVLFLSMPSVALGFITSVFGRFIHHFNKNYTGRFMAVDTIGSVVGSLGTTLVLMPFIGLNGTIFFLVLVNVLALLLILKLKDIKFYVIPSLAAMCLALILNSEVYMTGQNTLKLDNAISRIEIEDADEQNGIFLSKLMKINGSFSSKISQHEDLQFGYINFINRIFINNLPQNEPADILVIGAGGFTVGLNDTFHHYTFLDIEKNLQKISEEYFLNKPLGENKKFIVRDGYLFLLNDKQKYDLIVVDVYSAVKSIPMNFTTVNFFKLVKARLKENGIMLANIITDPSFKDKFSKRIDNTLHQALGNTLSRTFVEDYNPYKDNEVNVLYVYHNTTPDEGIYTLNKNTSFYDKSLIK